MGYFRGLDGCVFLVFFVFLDFVIVCVSVDLVARVLNRLSDLGA